MLLEGFLHLRSRPAPAIHPDSLLAGLMFQFPHPEIVHSVVPRGFAFPPTLTGMR